MKKVYVKPMMEIETFSNSEYVAACTIGAEAATLEAECINTVFHKAFGTSHWGDTITNLQTVHILGKTWVAGNVQYKVDATQSQGQLAEPVTDWVDNDKDGEISEGDFIEWRSDCYGYVKSTQNHS